MDLHQRCMGCMEPKESGELCPRCSWSDTYSVQPQLYLSIRTLLQNRYVVGRSLGYGGYSATYIAWDNEMDRKVAIREYLPGGMITRSFGNPMALILTPDLQPVFDHGLSLFVREAESVQALGSQQWLPETIQVFRQNGTAYLVTEYLDGMDFATYLKRHPSGISVELALRMLLPVVAGLEQAHAHGLLHENVAPVNIYLTRSAQVKVLDFGHGRRFLRRHLPRLDFGIKDGYAAEEQYRPDGQVGPWTDVYSAAAVFYFALTGKVPPPAPERVARDTLLPLVIEDQNLQGAILRGLQVHGTYRFPTMEYFHRAVRGLPIVESKMAVQAQGMAGRYPPQSKLISPYNTGAVSPGLTSPISPPAASGPNTPVLWAPEPPMPSQINYGPPRISTDEATRILEPMSPAPKKAPLWLLLSVLGLLVILGVLAYTNAGPLIPLLQRDNQNAPQHATLIRFELVPESINQGGEATIRWEVAGAKMVTINGVRVQARGQTTIKPDRDSSYQLVATDEHGDR
ncbi:MAG TPA: serine/threonine-protein kinase, partial [Bryobacteraceae bacterium]|nr:serine/threonine-protein kinase [Bryobacteraceae bacterium]